MDKVYVVVETEGMYEPNITNICAFLDREAAETHASQLTKDIDGRKAAQKAMRQFSRGQDNARDIEIDGEMLKLNRSINHQECNLNTKQRDHEKLAELKSAAKKLRAERDSIREQQKQEMRDFIHTLDFLTDEQKIRLSSNPWHSTDVGYDVEEIELRG